MASRRVNVDPSRVTGIARVQGSAESEMSASSISQSSSDDTMLTGQDPKDLLDVCGVERGGRLVRRGQRSDPRRGRPGATLAVRKLDRRRAARPTGPQHIGRERLIRACGLGWRGRRSAAATAEVLPRSSMACSMSARRLENARSTAFGMSRSSLRPLRRISQAKPERRQLGAEGGVVEGAGRHLPREEVPAVGGRPAAVGALNQVGDDDMGMELGIASPAGAVPKGGADEPLGLDQLGPAMAPAGVAGLFGEVIEYGGDGLIVGG